MPPLDYGPVTRHFYADVGTQTVQVTKLLNYNLWSKVAQERLKELAQLPTNWNGYGSPKISSDAIGECLTLLTDMAKLGMPMPSIIPISGGGLQIEWRNAKCELEIEIMPDKSVHYLITDSSKKMLEGSIVNNSNIAEFMPLTSWFMSEKVSISDLSVYAAAY